MQLNNYLEKLSKDPFNENNSPICVWGLGGLVSNIYKEIKANYNKNILKLLSVTLDVKSQNCRDIYHWMKGNNPIPVGKFLKLLKLWEKTCNKGQKDSKKILDEAFMKSTYFSTKRGRKLTLPKILTPELAYLLGYIAGDGHLLDPYKHMEKTGDFEFKVEITSDSHFVLRKILAPYFSQVFKIEGGFYKYKERNAYEYYIGSKILSMFLNQICDLPLGKKAGKLKIPKMILESNKKKKFHFLAGFFDSDGCITTNKKIGFGLGKSEKIFLEKLKFFLKSLNINTRKITKLGGQELKGWETSISWDSLPEFISNLPSKHPEKSKKLEKLKMELVKNDFAS